MRVRAMRLGTDESQVSGRVMREECESDVSTRRTSVIATVSANARAHSHVLLTLSLPITSQILTLTLEFTYNRDFLWRLWNLKKFFYQTLYGVRRRITSSGFVYVNCFVLYTFPSILYISALSNQRYKNYDVLTRCYMVIYATRNQLKEESGHGIAYTLCASLV